MLSSSAQMVQGCREDWFGLFVWRAGSDWALSSSLLQQGFLSRGGCNHGVCSFLK